MTVPDPMLGIEIGRYRVEKLLGQGGMGTVYLAVQPAIGSRVAIKVLSAECARSPELLERFFAEARAVNLIRHESIVSVTDLAQLDDGRPYIVMEFVEGQTLGEMVRTASPLPIGGVVQVITEMLSALAAAHERGVVHRDLKPDNIIVTREGHAKVLDFGIAKLAPGLGNANSPRTATGALLGTPAYMAPEQISGAQNVDARTDIYAAGVLLFECITGAQPFLGETLFDLMRAHLETSPPPPSRFRPDLPPRIERVILTALEKDPAKRFQSAAAMAEALRLAAGGLAVDQWRTLSGKVLTGRPSLQHVKQPTGELVHSQPRSATPVPSPPPQPNPMVATRGARKGMLIALGLVGVVALGIAVLVATQHEASPFDGSVVMETAPAPADGGVVMAPPDTAITPPLNPATPRLPATKPSELGSGPPTTVASRPPATGVSGPPATVGSGPPPAVGTRPPTTRLPPGDVHIDGTLVIGTTVPEADLLRKSITYNPKRFDGRAFGPVALAIAREKFADAGFVTMELTPVGANGLVDLFAEDANAEFMFRSPSHQGTCYVEVVAHSKQVIARVRDRSTDPKCKAPLRPLPKCSIASVWKKTRNVQANQQLTISFLADGAWFSSNLIDDDNVSETIADTCP